MMIDLVRSLMTQENNGVVSKEIVSLFNTIVAQLAS
jgi:hypothetical protein